MRNKKPEFRKRAKADFMDDGGEPEWIFCIMLLHSGGVTKRASIPLASAESRWWESGAPGGKNGAMVGREEREERMKGKAEELRFRERKQTPPPSPGEEKNKWLGETRCFCSSCSEPVYLEGRGLVYDKDGMSWRKGGQKRGVGKEESC